MSRDHDYESELTGSRNEIAAALSGVADGILAGSIRLEDGAEAVVVDTPEEMTLEIELEAEDDELSLELELEWPQTAIEESPAITTEASSEGTSGTTDEIATDDSAATSSDDSSAGITEDSAAGTAEDSSTGTTDDSPEEPDEIAVPVGAADASQMLARFELYRDRADEWRWRLRHRNGNIIATSGEGYTRKHNAQKGLRSVVQNAPDAETIENPEQ